MNRQRFASVVILMLLLLISNCARVFRLGPPDEQKLRQRAYQKIERCIRENMSPDSKGPVPAQTKIDTILVDIDSLRIDLHLSKQFSYQPFRSENVGFIYRLFKNHLGGRFNKFDLTIYSMEIPIEEFVPNFFREDTTQHDRSRMPKTTTPLTPPVLQNMTKPSLDLSRGLANRNIALWHSHGFYYTRDKDRWEWQRPRLFCTVEDLLPMSFTIPYLVPMLENAGAMLFIPRERSLQTHEIVIDNDDPQPIIGNGLYRELNSSVWQTGTIGFATGQPPYPANLNPFLQGSHRYCKAEKNASAAIEWVPEFPEKGGYDVYISYHHAPENIPDARYSVYHLGGRTDFRVNQQVGGGTWLHLGEFKFKKGINPEQGKVVLSNESEFHGRRVTADAVRFGGGMGNVLRGGRVSGYPRFAEAARYYLQYAGMPDTLVYHLNQDTSDYKDDYQSRAEFANFLNGKPAGPNKKRSVDGLGIPIDLTLSFHTDAGIDTTDGTIGTLMIYSIEDAETLRVFPNGMSRLANRDLGDIVQTQIVDDIRKIYRPDWNRRGLRNADYSEAFRPNVPGILLELLSHQNFGDMIYALSPQFRFDAARAIYKGMLKFIATQNRFDYVVQPLPVSHFQAVFSNSAQLTLKWLPVEDPLEPTATVEQYVVYQMIEGQDFDHGTVVDSPEFTRTNLQNGVIYSFKVTAVNQGGESFPSEILSVCWIEGCEKPALIVNGFDRVGPPQIVVQPEFKGFLPMLDAGVPDKYDFNYTGIQFDFNPRSSFFTNDAPGHGASQANFETRLRAGNSFNYPAIHGAAIRHCGLAFVSCSDEAVMDGLVDLKQYPIVDIIFGEEKAHRQPGINRDNSPLFKINRGYQVFPAELQEKIYQYCESGGNLFVSGAHIGSDLFSESTTALKNIVFARQALKMIPQTDHAALTGKVFISDSAFGEPFSDFFYNTHDEGAIYAVESPDAINPTDEARTIIRYAENRFSAGIAFSGEYNLVVFGFPFETIIGENQRNQIMENILRQFGLISTANKLK
ncbi:MAG TPA: xanthan lyase [bacterium]|nr:xanthan lyase [bacterium]